MEIKSLDEIYSVLVKTQKKFVFSLSVHPQNFIIFPSVPVKISSQNKQGSTRVYVDYNHSVCCDVNKCFRISHFFPFQFYSILKASEKNKKRIWKLGQTLHEMKLTYDVICHHPNFLFLLFSLRLLQRDVEIYISGWVAVEGERNEEEVGGLCSLNFIFFMAE
jgi:hypothetical protein